MGTRVTIDGVELPDGADIAEAIREKPPAERYLLVRDGRAVAAVMYDGVSEFDPGGELVREADWRGDPPAPEPEPVEVVERRSAEDRARAWRRQLGQDLEVVDTATIAQLRPIVRRLIRAQRLSLALALAETSGEPEDRE